MKSFYFYETFIGKIAIGSDGESITDLCFGIQGITEKFREKEMDVIKKASQELVDYFSGKLQHFSVPLNPKGTDFMKKVWGALQKIPHGKTASYKDIAELSGHPKAYRAVGLANNKNPIPIFIPCHRVIGTNGKLTGFRGGLDLKQKLLDLERKSTY